VRFVRYLGTPQLKPLSPTPDIASGGGAGLASGCRLAAGRHRRTMKQHVIDPAEPSAGPWGIEEVFGDGPGQPDHVEEVQVSPDSPPVSPRDPSSHGLMVEIVRLIAVGLFAVAGWEIGVAFSREGSPTHLVGVLLGTSLGYVVGGMFGRQTLSAVSSLEREFARVPAAEILSGAIGLVFGLILATLLALPLYHLPPTAAYPSVAFVYLTLGYLAYKLGRTKSDDFFGLFGVKTRVAGVRPGEVSVLDSSAVLDGRIVALIRMGFLTGTLLVSRAVLTEVQAVADSSNPSRRVRGRRALDLLVDLRRDPGVDVSLVDDAEHPDEPVDIYLVRLARARGASLVTNDAGLAKVASALEVPVRSIHALAEALRPVVLSGDVVPVRLTRRGKDSGQAVGYLDDGTMVVVEDADSLLGQTVRVSITNVLQTSTGQLIFATVADQAATDGSAGT
jgi:uncharacterized protein YacL